MERIVYEQLKSWKASHFRKPLLIRGARQVGKTWLMKTFGEREYKNCIYLNFENNSRLRDVFSGDIDLHRIVMALEIESEKKIEPDNTLLIFDEIQEVPRALTSLKYFCEEMPQLHIMAAGSYLGVATHPASSFPVGKVDFINVYPLSFYEFLSGIGEGKLAALLSTCDWPLITAFRSKFTSLLRQYLYIGGMPEVVYRFSETKDFNEVRQVKKNILLTYEQDFSKHAPVEVIPRIRMVWQAIPSQLAKENRKFVYGHIRQGARAKDFEIAIQWLLDTGLAHIVYRVNKPGLPLVAYKDSGAFKLFFLDVGLMASMAGLDIKVLLDETASFSEFKGALTEQYVLQQLVSTTDNSMFYWSAKRSDAEIDFLLQYKNTIVPLEVKASENLHAKSLRFFNIKHQPGLSVRTSLSDYRDEGWLVNVPLYAAGTLPCLLSGRKGKQ